MPLDSSLPSRPPANPLKWVLLLSAGLLILFMVISGAVMMAKPHVRGRGVKAGGTLFSDGSVGVIELKGVIMDSRKTLHRLEKFEEDDDIKAVVLRLDSPGGSVAPSQEIYEAVRKFKKPLVVSMGSVAASGAFYVACGAKKVFANAGTLTGSIGVIMEFLNLSKLYEWAKVKRFALTTGKYKGSGAEYRDMTADERALLQRLIDNVLGQFKDAVVQGRKIPMSQLDPVADGRIFSGTQAKELKLVDEIGTLDDAINEAAREAKLTGKPTVVYPEKNRPRWLDMILDQGGTDEESSRAQAGGGLVRLARALLYGQTLSAQSDEQPAPGIYWLWTGAH